MMLVVRDAVECSDISVLPNMSEHGKLILKFVSIAFQRVVALQDLDRYRDRRLRLLGPVHCLMKKSTSEQSGEEHNSIGMGSVHGKGDGGGVDARSVDSTAELSKPTSVDALPTRLSVAV